MAIPFNEEDILNTPELVDVPSARLIVTGLGHMGRRGFLSLISLINHLRQRERPISVEIVGIVDPDERPIRAVKEICEPLSLKPIYGSSLEEVVEVLQKKAETTGVIIYDASPTSRHINNLFYASKNGMIYLGEKPLITHVAQKKLLTTYNFFCDFIETENIAFYTLCNFLRVNNVSSSDITSLRFWRHSCMAFEVIRGERGGVEGGALLDKAPHDLSITAALLGAHNIHYEISVPPYGGGFLTFYDFASIDNDPPLFMTTDRWKSIKIDETVADAIFEMHIEWQLPNRRSVPAEYSFSWVGVRPSLSDALIPLGFSKEEFMGEVPVKGDDSKPGYMLQEARICLLECVNNVGEKFTLVANFLPKLGLTPSVWQVKDGKPEKLPLLPLRFEENSLTRILKRVILYTMQRHRCDEIGHDYVSFVHEVMLKARSDAFKQEVDFSEVVNKSRQIFSQNLRR